MVHQPDELLAQSAISNGRLETAAAEQGLDWIRPEARGTTGDRAKRVAMSDALRATVERLQDRLETLKVRL